MGRQNSGVYLGKAGQIYGPYKDDEIEELRASGKLAEFTWIWDHTIQGWKAIELPPQAPKFAPPGSSSKVQAVSADKIQVVCHDYRSIVSGTLRNVTQTGCEIVSADSSSSPRFPDRGNILINLLNEQTGYCMNVQAKLAEISRNEGAWTYRVRWERCPDILIA